MTASDAGQRPAGTSIDSSGLIMASFSTDWRTSSSRCTSITAGSSVSRTRCAAMIVPIALWMIRKLPRRWWLALWIGSIPLTILLIVVAPVIIGMPVPVAVMLGFMISTAAGSLAAGFASYFATLWLTGFRLRDFKHRSAE